MATEEDGKTKAIPSDGEIRRMCKMRQVNLEDEQGAITYSWYAMVNFRSETSQKKCIFNHSTMTGVENTHWSGVHLYMEKCQE